MATHSEIIKLIDQAIRLDVEDIQVWKQSPDVNTEFARQNIEADKQSMNNLLQIRKKHAIHTT